MTPRDVADKALKQHHHHLEESLRTLKGVVEATGKPWDEVMLMEQQNTPWPILACSDICVRGVAIWRVQTTFDEVRSAVETRIREM